MFNIYMSIILIVILLVIFFYMIWSAPMADDEGNIIPGSGKTLKDLFNGRKA